MVDKVVRAERFELVDQNGRTRAKRTVQEWVKETPNFPEMALKDGILTEENILPNFIPLLRLDIFHADLQQEIPSAAQEDSSLGVKQKIAVGVAAVIFIMHLFKKRPPGQGFRLTGPSTD